MMRRFADFAGVLSLWLWALGAASAQEQPLGAPESAATPHRPEAAEVLQAPERAAARRHIEQQRAWIKTRQQEQETACYQKFAVENCLIKVRKEVRHEQARLRLQEVQLNDADRIDKEQARLRALQEKQKHAPAAVPPAAAALRKPAPDLDAAQTLREQEAAQRAQAQRERVLERSQAQAERSAKEAERAAKARARQDAKLQAAQAHRERLEKSQADRAVATSGSAPHSGMPMSGASKP